MFTIYDNLHIVWWKYIQNFISYETVALIFVIKRHILLKNVMVLKNSFQDNYKTPLTILRIIDICCQSNLYLPVIKYLGNHQANINTIYPQVPNEMRKDAVVSQLHCLPSKSKFHSPNPIGGGKSVHCWYCL